MQIDLLSVVIGWLGGVITVVATHRLTLARDRIERRNDLRGFLGRWLGRILREPDVSKAHADWLEHLWGYYGKTRRDFVQKDQFRDLCVDLVSLKAEDIQKDADCRQTISRKIEVLIDFV